MQGEMNLLKAKFKKMAEGIMKTSEYPTFICGFSCVTAKVLPFALKDIQGR
jgi:hypothetical protein